MLLLSLLAARCDRSPEPRRTVGRAVATACTARPEGSRWAGEYASTAVFGDDEDEEMASTYELAGVAVGDSLVYVLETNVATLWVLRPDLSVVRRVGREGGGPGEWRPATPSAYGGSTRWVDASGADVRLFEGMRIQAFSREGRFRRMIVGNAPEAGISPMQSRLAFLGDTLLYTRGGHDPMLSLLRDGTLSRPALVDGRVPWRVRMRAGDDDRAVLEIGLVPVPWKTGVGPAQARPLWDTNGACVVASDGAEPWLVHALLSGGGQDTVPIPLPDRADRMEDYVEMMGGVLQPGMELEQPTAARRIRDLVLDPDGYVWLAPVPPREEIEGGGKEVIRVPLGGGAAVTDTVPAFPRAFGGPGVFYAETRGPDDEILVTRYDLRGGG
jgi:hypothetical protein